MFKNLTIKSELVPLSFLRITTADAVTLLITVAIYLDLHKYQFLR